MSPSPTHGKICYLILSSDDPDRDGAFYRDVFGWSLRRHGDGARAFDDATGQVSGMWTTDGQPASEPGLDLHIMVDDLDAAMTAIRAAGGSIVKNFSGDGSGERYAWFRDPAGNRLGIYEHRPMESAG